MLTSSEKRHKTSPLIETDQYIVAIGASAGGLEAIQEFFDNMPSNGNLSFVIIQHLSADYKSLLVEIISKHTHMKVQEAAHNAPVEKSCVYVIPNAKLLTIRGGLLQLTEKKVEKAPNTAIDFFLKSLAEDQGAKAIAVVLSGTGSDGSKGIEMIQAAGGMVLVQDPITAKFDGMPNSAIASGYADYILAPELMPEEIFNYIKERPIRIAGDGKPDETYLPEILKFVEKSCQYDFANYKTPTILRRIGRRMTQMGYKKFSEYLNFLRSSSEECKLLGKEFLIGVTKFFRDKTAFDILRDEVLTEMIHAKADGEMLKIWVTACSTGEEAYSIAILADDLLQRMGRNLEVKIFATDIDLDAIEFASKGQYPASSIAEMESHLARRYFVQQDGQVVIHPQLRKQIVFARHNILKDPPFIKNDLITCRNMLIYMNSILQRRVFSTLQFSLNTGGHLFLGPSEIPASVRDGLQEINGKWKIYRKISADNRYNPERFPSTQAFKKGVETRHVPGRENPVAKELAEDFKKLLTEEYGFAAVYVDKNFDVKEAVGDFKKYLSLPEKGISLQLLKMVRPEISASLNAALRKVVKEGCKASVNNVRLRGSEDEKGVNIFIKPATKEGLFLVGFSEGFENLSRAASHLLPEHATESAAYVAELEDELKETRANLQMAIESLETANEELQSSNEELLSANEELQSSNEELQSLNEELHTLNTEHQLRIKELIELNDDLNNYFRSTEIAQVFVDANLRIRKFNPAAVQMINLIETDIGRPIEHISTNIKDDNLYKDILQVLKEEKVREKEVVLSDGRISLMRILPYLRQDKQVDGVVISFIDISDLKEMDNIIKAVFNASPNVIIALKVLKEDRKTTLQFLTGNKAADELTGKSLDEKRGYPVHDVFSDSLKGLPFAQLLDVVANDSTLQTEVFLDTNEGNQWFQLMASKMGKEGVVMTLTNVHEKKMAEDKFRRSYHELLKSKEAYRNLNVQLEEKVTERTFALSQSEERFRLIANATTDAVWDWDLVNNHIWWSESFYTRFGFKKEDTVNNSGFWLARLHPDDMERVNANLQEAINNGEKDWKERFRFQKADGSYATIQNRGAVLSDAQGMPYRMVGAMMDITESVKAALLLQEKNEALQSAMDEFKFVTDFMPQLVWATRPDGYHDFYNKGWYDYTGLSYEETKDKGWSLVLHPDDYVRTWAAWKESLQTGKPYQIEYRFRRYDGEYRWFLGRALPLRDENGKILKWFGTCTDIHDQKTAADVLEQKVQERTAELQKMNLELEASNAELLQFASVASHDLKEPLRKIHLFGNLIRERYLTDKDESAREYMNRIILSSARMTRLINDLLNFTRLSMNSETELTDLTVVVEEVLSDLEVVIEEKSAKVHFGQLPKIEAVPGQVRQVFQNLISNALKFSKPDVRPEINIRFDYVEECSLSAPVKPEGHFCRIEIADNGIGFDDLYVDKIFTIFQRLHPREKYEGTGIGLAITRKIVERYKGLVHAFSQEGEGSRFVIVLPLKQGEEN
ncbi:chemotaxis protein CheB [Flavisolibacter ginsenosidimutans]|uniref:PAS domain S-box protein n=1 Tax=Flavisolibacter ginsenosidimutans TaxID=661481 RepID=A0A5B8UGI5_9BACT|nr:chemotaxis protein CheB [Flavisolibacter ginsenosidimutans]QEC55747.1 PAS domain S-box protein [Flavisolibacter ginsenosidimutans]